MRTHSPHRGVTLLELLDRDGGHRDRPRGRDRRRPFAAEGLPRRDAAPRRPGQRAARPARARAGAAERRLRPGRRARVRPLRLVRDRALPCRDGRVPAGLRRELGRARVLRPGLAVLDPREEHRRSGRQRLADHDGDERRRDGERPRRRRLPQGPDLPRRVLGVVVYAYFTSAQTVQPLAAAGVQSITSSRSWRPNPFRRQDVAVANACFTAAVGADPARLFLVNRYRFHVRPVDARRRDAVRPDPRARPGHRHRSRRGRGRRRRAAPRGGDRVDPGLVRLQLGRARAGRDDAPGAPSRRSANTAAAATTTANAITTTLFPGTPPPSPGPNDTAYTPSSFYPYTFGPPAAAERLTNHQANIQVVRVAVLARSVGSDVQGRTRAERVPPAPEPERAARRGSPATPAALGGHDGYQRVVLETTGEPPEHGDPRDDVLLRSPMPVPPRDRSALGSTLLLVVILLGVLAAIGAAAVSLSSRDRINAGAKSRRDLMVRVRLGRPGEDLGGARPLRPALARERHAHQGADARRRDAPRAAPLRPDALPGRRRSSPRTW